MANVHTRHGPLPHATANAHWDANTLSVPWPPRAPPSPQGSQQRLIVHAHDAVVSESSSFTDTHLSHLRVSLLVPTDV
jgi:hypothetical protein